MEHTNDKKRQAVNKIKDILTNFVNLFTNGEPLNILGLGKDTGEYGEFASEYVLHNRALTNLSYIKTIHNVYVEKGGFTTEIDVIAITEKGLFVIESKNYGGWIFGDIDSEKWMQTFERGQKNQFYNPIKQNAGHIKKLAEYLELDPHLLKSYIVFSDRCTLRKVPRETASIKVIKRNQLLWNLRSILKKSPSVFSPSEVDIIYEKLIPLTNKTNEEKEQHIKMVKDIQNGIICPWCKSPLVLKKGKYGNFYACSGYPKCKFTKKLNM